MKFALFVSNRTTFPQEIVMQTFSDVKNALKRNHLESVDPGFAVADRHDAEQYAKWLKKQHELDGILAVFPNFGDEGSCFDALRDAVLPVLFVAIPDTLDAMGPALRRDAFCGKISAMNLFHQGGVPCTALEPHTVDPDSAVFDANLRRFAAICRVANGMKRLRTGSIGARCTPFKTVRFDERTLER